MFKRGDRITRLPEVTKEQWLEYSLLNKYLYNSELEVAEDQLPGNYFIYLKANGKSGYISRPHLFRLAKTNDVALEVDDA